MLPKNFKILQKIRFSYELYVKFNIKYEINVRSKIVLLNKINESFGTLYNHFVTKRFEVNFNMGSKGVNIARIDIWKLHRDIFSNNIIFLD